MPDGRMVFNSNTHYIAFRRTGFNGEIKTKNLKASKFIALKLQIILTELFLAKSNLDQPVLLF